MGWEDIIWQELLFWGFQEFAAGSIFLSFYLVLLISLIISEFLFRIARDKYYIKICSLQMQEEKSMLKHFLWYDVGNQHKKNNDKYIIMLKRSSHYIHYIHDYEEMIFKINQLENMTPEQIQQLFQESSFKKIQQEDDSEGNQLDVFEDQLDAPFQCIQILGNQKSAEIEKKISSEQEKQNEGTIQTEKRKEKKNDEQETRPQCLEKNNQESPKPFIYLILGASKHEIQQVITGKQGILKKYSVCSQIIIYDVQEMFEDLAKMKSPHLYKYVSNIEDLLSAIQSIAKAQIFHQNFSIQASYEPKGKTSEEKIALFAQNFQVKQSQYALRIFTKQLNFNINRTIPTKNSQVEVPPQQSFPPSFLEALFQFPLLKQPEVTMSEEEETVLGNWPITYINHLKHSLRLAKKRYLKQWKQKYPQYTPIYLSTYPTQIEERYMLKYVAHKEFHKLEEQWKQVWQKKKKQHEESMQDIEMMLFSHLLGFPFKKAKASPEVGKEWLQFLTQKLEKETKVLIDQLKVAFKIQYPTEEIPSLKDKHDITATEEYFQKRHTDYIKKETQQNTKVFFPVDQVFKKVLQDHQSTNIKCDKCQNKIEPLLEIMWIDAHPLNNLIVIEKIRSKQFQYIFQHQTVDGCIKHIQENVIKEKNKIYILIFSNSLAEEVLNKVFYATAKKNQVCVNELIFGYAIFCMNVDRARQIVSKKKVNDIVEIFSEQRSLLRFINKKMGILEVMRLVLTSHLKKKTNFKKHFWF